jgi:3-hydroxyacyl-CoA dehydrogenase
VSDAGFQRVAVIGAGTMGNGIAQTFASHGAEVVLIDVVEPALKKGLATIEKSLGKFAEKGKISAADAKRHRAAREARRRRCRTRAAAELVVEAVVEKAEVKRKVFQELDGIAPSATILATNTSSISITAIAAATKRADRVIGMHFMNPVPLMALVEVIRGQETSDATTQRVMSAARAIGKTPVEANDYPGFVSNRGADAHDQRGGLLPHGGRGHERVHRHGDEARHEPPDGPARAGRPDRARRVPRHPRGAARRAGRRQVPSVPAAAAHGCCRSPGKKAGRGFYDYT